MNIWDAIPMLVETTQTGLPTEGARFGMSLGGLTVSSTGFWWRFVALLTYDGRGEGMEKDHYVQKTEPRMVDEA